jgi:hypothetical protein
MSDELAAVAAAMPRSIQASTDLQSVLTLERPAPIGPLRRNRNSKPVAVEANREHDPESTLTEEAAREICRFEPADWELNEESIGVTAELKGLNAAIAKFWEGFEAEPLTDERILVDAPAATRVVLQAIGSGMLAATKRIDWTLVAGRDSVTLLVWANDPDDPEVVRAVARELNPVLLFERFSQ